MTYETQDGLYALVNKVGNVLKNLAGTVVTASAPLFVDANSAMATGNIPFTFPLFAGVTSTSASVISIEGSSTGSANELYHQTLVDGATVTTWTKTGFMRITVTDDAGNITSGAHYIQFGTLT